MGNYPHTAEDFKNAESHTFGSIVDPWVTGYNYDASGGQYVHSHYRKNFKICKIYAEGGRMWGYKKDGTGKVWLSDEQGTPYGDSFERAKQVKGYGTGPMMLVSGTIQKPNYFMKIGSELSPDWSWAQINSMHDIENAMSMNKGVNRMKRLAEQSYDAGHLGTASRNLFLGQKPGDINSWAIQFNKSVDTIGSKLLIGAAEAVVDEFVPFASTIFQLSGGEAATQEALDNMISKKYSSTTANMYEQERTRKLDPLFQEAIHDERVDERLTKLKPYMKKYENVDITYMSKHYSQKEQLGFIQGWEKFVNNSVVNEQMEALDKQYSMAQNVLGTQDYDFTKFKRGWKESKLEERLSLLIHYKNSFKERVLPRLEDKLTGLHTDFESALQTKDSGSKGSEKEHQSVLQEKKYIVGDIERHQITAHDKLSLVQG